MEQLRRVKFVQYLEHCPFYLYLEKNCDDYLTYRMNVSVQITAHKAFPQISTSSLLSEFSVRGAFPPIIATLC